jgi:peptidoglycan/LPS O-acetylase OafA/YrhL
MLAIVPATLVWRLSGGNATVAATELFVVAAALSLALAWLLYRIVERPGILAGKALVGGDARPQQAASSESPAHPGAP